LLDCNNERIKVELKNKDKEQLIVVKIVNFWAKVDGGHLSFLVMTNRESKIFESEFWPVTSCISIILS